MAVDYASSPEDSVASQPKESKDEVCAMVSFMETI